MPAYEDEHEFLAGTGGEPLIGSGLENELPDPDFADAGKPETEGSKQ